MGEYFNIFEVQYYNYDYKIKFYNRCRIITKHFKDKSIIPLCNK